MATSRHRGDGKRSPERKVIPLNIRVAESEKAAFTIAADVAGLPISAWIRERLRLAAARELEQAGRSIPFLEDDEDF